MRAILNWKLARQARDQQKEIEDNIISIQENLAVHSDELKKTIQMIHHEQQRVITELNNAHQDIDDAAQNGGPQSNGPPTPLRDATSNLDDE